MSTWSFCHRLPWLRLTKTIWSICLHLEPRVSVYTMHKHGIYHVYVDVLHIHGIYMVYPWIYHVYPYKWILESWWKMGQRESSGQVTNVLNSVDACLSWKSRKKRTICKGGGSCSSDEPERLDWMFIAITLNSELSFASDQKTAANTWQFKFTIRAIWYLLIVETHSIPDKKEDDNLTEINVDATQ